MLTTAATENWASVTPLHAHRHLEIEPPMRRGEQAAGAKIRAYDASALRDQQAGRVPLPQARVVIRPVVDEVGACAAATAATTGAPRRVRLPRRAGERHDPARYAAGGAPVRATAPLREPPNERGVPVMVTTHDGADARHAPPLRSATPPSARGSRAPARPPSSSTRTATSASSSPRPSAPSRSSSHSAARDVLVHVLTPDDASAAGRALEVHHQMSGAFVANGATDSAASAASGCRSPRRGGRGHRARCRRPPSCATSLVEPAQAGGGRTEAQYIEVRPEPVPAVARPPPAAVRRAAAGGGRRADGAPGAARAEHRRHQDRARARRTSEQLELLCREYQRRDPRQRQLHATCAVGLGEGAPGDQLEQPSSARRRTSTPSWCARRPGAPRGLAHLRPLRDRRRVVHVDAARPPRPPRAYRRLTLPKAAPTPSTRRRLSSASTSARRSPPARAARTRKTRRCRCSPA